MIYYLLYRKKKYQKQFQKGAVIAFWRGGRGCGAK
jgi:hypothetical protein